LLIFQQMNYATYVNRGADILRRQNVEVVLQSGIAEYLCKNGIFSVVVKLHMDLLGLRAKPALENNLNIVLTKIWNLL